MAQALGANLLDRNGNELLPGGAALAHLNRIDISKLDSRLAGCRVTVASDVTSPLYGERGASRVYGPQKGATEEMCRQLDNALKNYAAVIKHNLGIEVGDLPGAGAAGGLGAGLVAFLRAELRPGIDIVCEAAGLSRHLQGADLVFTGEGRIDAQTMSGKTVVGVAARARAHGVPVIVIAGDVAISNEELMHYGINAALSIAPGPISLDESTANAGRFITETTERAMRLIMIGHDRTAAGD
jgi:glycerate kinase